MQALQKSRYLITNVQKDDSKSCADQDDLAWNYRYWYTKWKSNCV